jgi:succinyl-diaminopimelate desuccinylase
VTDLVDLTATLIDIRSESHDEERITDWLEAQLRGAPWLEIDRVGDNLIARTNLGRSQRAVLAGHTDTVPANGNERAVIEGNSVRGLGASDMKGGLAVMLDIALTVDQPAVDVTYVFYAGEEVAGQYNGLRQLFADVPDLVTGDIAVLGEPTGGVVEAGCQGSMRAEVTLIGTRAHTARPWMGRNAIHRLGRVLALLDAWDGRRPVIDGCEYREAVQAVFVEGGVAGNVVPDRAKVVINHRFAPDRTPAEAEAFLHALIAPALDDGDAFEVVDAAVAAAPGLEHPLFRGAIDRNHLEVRAKLGWTDVARFAGAGIPAINLGPGDPTLAHTAGEFVTRAQLERTATVLRDLIGAS